MLGPRAGERETERLQGQATVEFALVILLLMMLVFGIVDFSRLLFAYATMSNGVREGARYGVVHRPSTQDPDEQPNDPAAIATIRHAEAMMILVGGEATVTVEYPGGDNPASFAPGCTNSYYCRVQVRAESDFNAWTPLIPNFTIVAQATMHFE
jgi:Flp pilus assembly protein TadG